MQPQLGSGQSPQSGGAKPPRGCIQALGLTCSTLMLMITIGIMMFVRISQNPKYQNPNTYIGGVVDMSHDAQNGQLIVDALNHYYAREGTYPKSLTILVPEFISDSTLLHSKLDRGKDPDAVSWTYFRPAPKAPQNTIVIDLIEQIQVPQSPQGQYTRYDLKLTLGGEVQEVPLLPKQ